MALIAAFSADREVQEAVERVAAPRRHVVATGSWRRLLYLVRERPVTAVVLDDAILYRGGGVGSAVRELRTRFPSVSCVVVARPLSDPHALVRLGRARVENLVLVPQDALDAGLRREIGRATRHGTLALVTRALSPYLPGRETMVLQAAMEAGRCGWNAECLASEVGLTRPHLSVRLKDAGLPSAGQLLVWARLLHAGRWLEDPGRSAESVSRQLDYSSGAAFRRALRNYADATPTDVIRGGGVFHVLDRFLAACTIERNPGADRSAA